MPIIIDCTTDDIRNMISEAVSEAFKAQGAEAENKMLTINDVCRICHISKPTFHAWVNNGTIEAQKVGRRTLIKSESLDQAMRTKKIYQFKHQD